MNDCQKLNGFIPFSELALRYYPHLSSASSASKKFRKRIGEELELLHELEKHNYTRQTHELSPLEVAIIFKYFGNPFNNLDQIP